jgi:hypothetical protein
MLDNSFGFWVDNDQAIGPLGADANSPVFLANPCEDRALTTVQHSVDEYDT